jgi:hypothetical protein
MKPSPQRAIGWQGCPATQLNPGSATRQLAAQPSPEARLPSSQASSSVCTPSPHPRGAISESRQLGPEQSSTPAKIPGSPPPGEPLPAPPAPPSGPPAAPAAPQPASPTSRAMRRAPRRACGAGTVAAPHFINAREMCVFWLKIGMETFPVERGLRRTTAFDEGLHAVHRHLSALGPAVLRTASSSPERYSGIGAETHHRTNEDRLACHLETFPGDVSRRVSAP